MWLLNQLLKSQNHPDPKYAFLGTVHWMRALSIVVQSDDFKSIKGKHYNDIKPKIRTDVEKNIIYENMLFSMHNIASLSSFVTTKYNPYNFVRAAIVCWYYSIYNSASAMIASVSGSEQATHTKTIRVFQNQIIDNNLAIGPFQLSLDSIVTNDVELRINILRNGNYYDLNRYPNTESEALGGIYSYLKGTAEFEKERTEGKIKSSKEFKALGVDNFRTRKARDLRDQVLSNSKINFLTQSFRYRGKANYRDSIYLSYGDDKSDLLLQFLEDMVVVSKSFFSMTLLLVIKCLPKDDIDNFINDLKKNVRFNFDYNLFNEK